MKESMIEEEQWNAVISSNKSYDGSFYYGVKTTGIFCRPSCKAKAPLRKNTIFFQSAEEAVQAGFRPCKLCRPDLETILFDPNGELVNKAQELIEKGFSEEYCIKNTAHKLGVSSNHLIRVFKQYSGITPNEYLLGVRIEAVKRLLLTSNMDIIEAAHESGFKSLSTFYKCFKEKTGITPKEYRNS